MTEHRFQGKVVHDNPCLGQQATLSGPKWKKLSPSLLASSDEVDTGWDLPADSIVHDIMLYVNTAEATGTTKTINVGLLASESGGNADGFVAGASVATTGWVKPGVTITATDGFASTTKGVLLSELQTGAGSTDSAYAEFPHIAGSVTAKSVSAQAATSDFAELDVDIYVLFSELV